MSGSTECQITEGIKRTINRCLLHEHAFTYWMNQQILFLFGTKMWKLEISSSRDWLVLAVAKASWLPSQCDCGARPMSSSETCFSLPRAYTDYFFATELVGNRLSVHRGVAGRFAASMRVTVESLFIFGSFLYVCIIVRTLHWIKTRLLLSTTAVVGTVGVVDAIMYRYGDHAVLKACGQRVPSQNETTLCRIRCEGNWSLLMQPCMVTRQFCRHAANMQCVRGELLFAATATDNTAAAIDTIIDGNCAVIKAHGQRSVMHDGKRKNKCYSYKATNRHEAFRTCYCSRTVSAEDYGDAVVVSLFRLDASAAITLLCRTFTAFNRLINRCVAK